MPGPLHVRLSCALVAVAAAVAWTPLTLQAQGPASESSGIVRRAVCRVLDRLHERASGVDLHVERSTWENPWVVATDHIEVRTTVSYAYGLDLAVGLERMMANLQQLLGRDHVPSQKFAVHLFPTIEQYNTFGDASLSGDEHSSIYGSFYAGADPGQPVISVFDANPIWVKMQVTHSFVHQWLASAYPGQSIPTWVDEGLASYFGLFWSYEWGIGQLERMKQADQLAGAERLLRDPVAAYSPARFTELGMFYYYLLRFREDTRTTLPTEAVQRSPFRDYIVAALEGREPQASTFTALLEDLPGLDRDFRAFEFPR